MRDKITKLVLFALFTRLIIIFIPWLSNTLVFSGSDQPDLVQFTKNSWNRWDAPHYLSIAESGYTNIGDEANFIVFFPLYPLLLKPLIMAFGNPQLVAVITSTLLFLLSVVFFYKLIERDFDEEIAWLATVILCVFPTSYFFNAPYTESVFFLTLCSSLYFARLKNWSLAGLLAGLATIARPLGFLVAGALFIEWLNSSKKSAKEILALTIPTIISGLTYLYLNFKVYGDPFMFQKILSSHWQKQFESPLSGIMSSWHIALTGGLDNFGIMVGWAEAITMTISWAMIPFVFRYLKKSWFVFYTLSIIIFSSTSFILSTPRYLLSLPPVFILIALFARKNELFRTAWLFLSASLLIILSFIFTTGQWAF